MKIFMFLLRLFPPEIAHTLALNILNFLYKTGLTKIFFNTPKKEKHFHFNNLTFKNRVGVAAGLDKNGDFIDAHFEGLAARVFHHEMDHMMGKTFLDGVSKILLQSARRNQKTLIRKVKKDGRRTPY